ncbi:MAG: purine-nucleoside phosphorylase [Eubacteriales bacterium]|jgi:purine-nucleoside phosphorylase
MTETEQQLDAAFDAVKDRIPFRPEVAVVLGSGLGDFASRCTAEGVIDYHTIPGFPVSTVPGHTGRFIFGHVGDVPVVMMQGRVHYYEGYPMSSVVLPVRLMRRMGAEILFLTNAAGGLDPAFHAGDLMLITDQISCFVPSPLIGPNPDSLGTRFPDMSHIYDPELQDIIRRAAVSMGMNTDTGMSSPLKTDIPAEQKPTDDVKQAGCALREGVYVQLTGPAYETPAETHMIRALGGSAVGMSTAVEAVVAVHCGYRVAGISLITNMAAGFQKTPLSHAEVQQAADAAMPVFSELLWRSVSACICG